ncbi:hypothetical protein DYBT9275_02214 [Dyadobacter sp. CECT 9275]|uniref:Uncharacterized protein n=1 Tax=Dyadobacter helix TaxID=2822344 RepID=A0A916JBF6_9BACT|nr:hypothetical protein DYBT9275_02214 [Dyadobacter sp. CECT 9275]
MVLFWDWSLLFFSKRKEIFGTAGFIREMLSGKQHGCFFSVAVSNAFFESNFVGSWRGHSFLQKIWVLLKKSYVSWIHDQRELPRSESGFVR